MQSSTITVAVLEEPSELNVRIDERDVEVRTCRAGGSGGQHVNKVESAVQITHRPSGLTVRCESERSQLQNRMTAFALLRARLYEASRTATVGARAATRKAQVGTGERSDKIRTYRYQDGVVTDHRTGKKARLDRILKGFLEDLR